MYSDTHVSSARDRRIGVRLTPRSVAPRVLSALRTLGYTLEVSPPDDTSDPELPSDRPGLWLIDSDRLHEIPNVSLAPDVSLLVFASPLQPRSVDPRVIGETTRPGQLSVVYELIQQALEQNPRRCPRITTRLAARCIRGDRRSNDSLVSLSEGGCLLRSNDALKHGSEVELQFALPDCGLISTPAECRYHKGSDIGLAFSDPTPDPRRSVANFVTLQLSMASESSAQMAVRQSA